MSEVFVDLPIGVPTAGAIGISVDTVEAPSRPDEINSDDNIRTSAMLVEVLRQIQEIHEKSGNDVLGDLQTLRCCSSSSHNVAGSFSAKGSLSAKSAMSSVKSGKSVKKKAVSFSEAHDLYYTSEYQEPYINPGDIVDEHLHVNIESMISGDEASTSQVSFSALNKNVAGSAFDTASFDDFPRRLSLVESEGPGQFSMDLVIQKLLNIQINANPTAESIAASIAASGNNSDDDNESCLLRSSSLLNSKFTEDRDFYNDLPPKDNLKQSIADLILAASKNLMEHHHKPKAAYRDAIHRDSLPGRDSIIKVETPTIIPTKYNEIKSNEIIGDKNGVKIEERKDEKKDDVTSEKKDEKKDINSEMTQVEKDFVPAFVSKVFSTSILNLFDSISNDPPNKNDPPHIENNPPNRNDPPHRNDPSHNDASNRLDTVNVPVSEVISKNVPQDIPRNVPSIITNNMNDLQYDGVRRESDGTKEALFKQDYKEPMIPKSPEGSERKYFSSFSMTPPMIPKGEDNREDNREGNRENKGETHGDVLNDAQLILESRGSMSNIIVDKSNDNNDDGGDGVCSHDLIDDGRSPLITPDKHSNQSNLHSNQQSKECSNEHFNQDSNENIKEYSTQNSTELSPQEYSYSPQKESLSLFPPMINLREHSAVAEDSIDSNIDSIHPGKKHEINVDRKNGEKDEKCEHESKNNMSDMNDKNNDKNHDKNNNKNNNKNMDNRGNSPPTYQENILIALTSSDDQDENISLFKRKILSSKLSFQRVEDLNYEESKTTNITNNYSINYHSNNNKGNECYLESYNDELPRSRAIHSPYSSNSHSNSHINSPQSSNTNSYKNSYNTNISNISNNSNNIHSNSYSTGHPNSVINGNHGHNGHNNNNNNNHNNNNGNNGNSGQRYRDTSTATTIDSRRTSINHSVAFAADPENTLRIKPQCPSTPINIPNDQVNEASQFRRHERQRRQESVAIDLAKGVERYRPMKLLRNILLLWIILPVGLCFLFYGIIPYDYTGAGHGSENVSSASENMVRSLYVRTVSLVNNGNFKNLNGSKGLNSLKSNCAEGLSDGHGDGLRDGLKDGLSEGHGVGSRGGFGGGGGVKRKLLNPGDSEVISSIEASVWCVSLIPWVLIMTCAASICVEIYSDVISEIEYGVVVWEDTPWCYTKVSLVAVCAAIAMQVLFFFSWGVAHHCSWLAMLAAGSAAITTLLYRKYYDGKRATIPHTGIFRRVTKGLFVLFLLSPVLYTIFTTFYTQFGSIRNGNLGYFAAAVFPFLRVTLAITMMKCPGLCWGSQRGCLCAVNIVIIVTSMWHGVYLSLIAASVATPNELIVTGIIELLLQGRVIYAISSLPSISIINTSEFNGCSRSSGSSSTAYSGLSGIRPKIDDQFMSQKVFNKGRNVIVIGQFSDDSALSKISNNNNNNNNNNNDSNNNSNNNNNNSNNGTGNFNNNNDNILAKGSIDLVDNNSQHPDFYTGQIRYPDIFRVEREEREERELKERLKQSAADGISEVSGSNKNSLSLPGGLSTCQSRDFIATPTVKGGGRARTAEDDFLEIRLATWLGVTWITGIATPLSFLICSSLLSIGPNRVLFSPFIDVRDGGDSAVFMGVSGVEIYAGLNRLWSVNIFNGNDGNNGNNIGDNILWSVSNRSGLNELVIQLLSVSASHMLILIIGCMWLRHIGGAWNIRRRNNLFHFNQLEPGQCDYVDSHYNCRASRDIMGVMSALLEYHFNIIGFTTVLTMAVVFSVIFPWYGMNSSFEKVIN